MDAGQKKATAAGTLVGLLVGLLLWSRFGLHGLFLCFVGGAGFGASVYGLIYGVMLYPVHHYPAPLIVGRKARVVAGAYIIVAGVYFACALAKFMSSDKP